MTTNKIKLALDIATGLSGQDLDSLIDSTPKGSTPNKYKPHVGKKQIEKALKRKANHENQN